MRPAITDADLDTAELSVGSHQAVADQLLAWANDPHPADVVSVKELITRAGEQLEYADDERAEDLYRQAVEAPGVAELDPRCHLMAMVLRRGALEEALVLDRELRRSRPTMALVYEYNGGTWAEHDPARALGWYNRGIRQHEEGEGFAVDDLGSLCWERWLFREEQGHPTDDYDLVGIGWVEQQREATESRLRDD